MTVSVQQLLGDLWSFGASYQWTESTLGWSYSEIPAGTSLQRLPGEGTSLTRTESALLHRVILRLGFHHPSGVFARAESQWLFQDNDGYPNAFNAPRPGDSVYQLDLQLGFRFARHRGEILLGCLNATGQDYRLNSLTPYAALPRERVWLGRCQWNF